MKTLLNKKGVTLLEGLIALSLLALVAVGTFGVLLSSSRKATTPDIQEETSLAVERAHKALQTFSPMMDSGMKDDDDVVDYFNGIIPEKGDLSGNNIRSYWSEFPFNPEMFDEKSEWDIKNMKSVICDGDTAEFSYLVRGFSGTTPIDQLQEAGYDFVWTEDNTDAERPILSPVQFKISCYKGVVL